MEITEVNISLVDGNLDNSGRLLAFASVVFDHCFCVRDLRIIDGMKGLFVSCPSRKFCDRCPRCHGKNELRQRFCGDCGLELPEGKPPLDELGRAKWTADTAHPVTTEMRNRLQESVLEAYQKKQAEVRQPILSGGIRT